jgi:hypothetical protein
LGATWARCPGNKQPLATAAPRPKPLSGEPHEAPENKGANRFLKTFIVIPNSIHGPASLSPFDQSANFHAPFSQMQMKDLYRNDK